MIRPVTLLILTISLIYLVNCANKWPALFFFLLGVLFRKAFKSAFCFLTPRCSGTSCWVGSPLPSSGQLRPRATRQNNISQFIAPASWFMCKKQDNLGCYYFTGTHTHMETHTLPEWDMEAYSSATSERVQYMHLLHTCTRT